MSNAKRGFVSKTEAIKARENTIKQLHEKTFVPFEYTAREFFDYWLYYYMIDEADIAYNTYTAYRNIIYNYFLVVWGDKKITAIQRDDLIAALDSIPYDSILRSAYGVIGGSFQYALENHIIYLNPVKSAIKVKRKTEKKCEIENNKKAEHVDQPPVLPAVYTLQQVTIMLYLCKQEEPKIFIALLLALTAGLRISEIIAIKYEDIDFGNHEIYIERQLGRSTKNEGLEDGKLLTQELRTKTRNSVEEPRWLTLLLMKLYFKDKNMKNYVQISQIFMTMDICVVRTMANHTIGVLLRRHIQG